MIDATKGLKSLLAILEAQKSRGWTAHNEFDYFTHCPTCGHWFDRRDPDCLMKHNHTTRVVVTTVVQAGVRTTLPAGMANDTPPLLRETPDGGAKS